MNARIFRRPTNGFSIIELLIAMLIAMILLLGITSLFSTTSEVNRMENGLARLQENGRFAIERIAQDLRMAGAMRGERKAAFSQPNSTFADRGLISQVDFGGADLQQHGLPPHPGGDFYQIFPSFFLRGYECEAGACTPADIPGAAGNGGDHYGGIPALGTGAGNRPGGADMITVRYLAGQGARVIAPAGATSLLPGNESGTSVITLAQPLDIGPSGLAVIGNHNSTVVWSLAERNGSFTSLTPANNINGAFQLVGPDSADIRVSDFDTSFLTVTYHLRLDNDPSVPGRLISTLIRRENGVVQEIARGIERLDFLYHLEDRNGNIHVMNAAQVSAPATQSLCPQLPIVDLPPAGIGMDAAFCGWRSVKAIEIFILSNTIDDTANAEEPYQYSFLNDGSRNDNGTIEVACDRPCGAANAVNTLISGLPVNRMMRREFRTVVTLRGNSP